MVNFGLSAIPFIQPYWSLVHPKGHLQQSPTWAGEPRLCLNLIYSLKHSAHEKKFNKKGAPMGIIPDALCNECFGTDRLLYQYLLAILEWFFLGTCSAKSWKLLQPGQSGFWSQYDMGSHKYIRSNV